MRDGRATKGTESVSHGIHDCEMGRNGGDRKAKICHARATDVQWRPGHEELLTSCPSVTKPLGKPCWAGSSGSTHAVLRPQRVRLPAVDSTTSKESSCAHQEHAGRRQRFFFCLELPCWRRDRLQAKTTTVTATTIETGPKTTASIRADLWS